MDLFNLFNPVYPFDLPFGVGIAIPTHDYVPVYIVSNLSRQPLTIPYRPIDESLSVSQVPFYQSGVFLLQPKKNLLIESARVDYEQLVNLERDGLIKLVRSRRQT